MVKKFIAIALCVLTVLALSSVSVSAKEISYAPYQGYEYGTSSESVKAPVGYLQTLKIDEKTMGTQTPLSAPNDIVYKNGKIYVLDSGNSRVLVLNTDFSLQTIREKFHTPSNEEITFVGAQGMDITDDGTLYIADTENNRVLVFDLNNQLIKEITRPDEALLDTGFPFRVTKISIDRQGRLIATAESVNVGAFRFDTDGKFLGFFGRNSVVPTADALLNYIYKKILTREQIKKLKNYTPNIIVNLDVDADGFVYLVDSSNTETGAAAVRKLNYRGNNVFQSVGIIDTFGDLEWDQKTVDRSFTYFGDIDISEEGFINLLDTGRKKVFQYTQNGQLISVSCGEGTQYGEFSAPSAIESINGKIYVCDSVENCIYELSPTQYVKALQNAFLLSDTDDNDAALDAWNKVLNLNTNSLYPYYGLGLVYEDQGNYQEAMEMFKISGSRDEYSNVLREYRQIYLQKNSWWILGLVIIFIIALVMVIKLLKKRYLKKKGTAFSILEGKYTFPLYTLFHPVDGFEQFKYRSNMTSWPVAIGIVAVWFLISFVSYFKTGFIFNYSDPDDYNIIVSLIESVFLYLLFVICNWGISSLFSGSGKFKEIACVTAYSLIPYILSKIIYLPLSHLLVAEESVFISIITVIGILWSFILLFGGLYSIHQYTAGKTIGNMLLTVIAMAVVVLIILLFFTLMRQLTFFIQTIVAEWKLR